MLKQNKKKKIYSLIIFFIGLIIILTEFGFRYYYQSKNLEKVNNFINDNSYLIIEEKENKTNYQIENSDTQDEYIGVLEIPKINLKVGFYNIDNINNNVSKGIEVIEKSDMPDVKNGTLILASHSGNGQVSYFKNLHKLSYKDIIYIYYNKCKYQYELIRIYEVDKNNMVEINPEQDSTSLVLITCSNNSDSKQIIYINKLAKIY